MPYRPSTTKIGSGLRLGVCDPMLCRPSTTPLWHKKTVAEYRYIFRAVEVSHLELQLDVMRAEYSISMTKDEGSSGNATAGEATGEGESEVLKEEELILEYSTRESEVLEGGRADAADTNTKTNTDTNTDNDTQTTANTFTDYANQKCSKGTS